MNSTESMDNEAAYGSWIFFILIHLSLGHIKRHRDRSNPSLTFAECQEIKNCNLL